MQSETIRIAVVDDDVPFSFRLVLWMCLWLRGNIRDGNCLIGSVEEASFSLPLKVRDAGRLKAVWQNHVFDRMRRASGISRRRKDG